MSLLFNKIITYFCFYFIGHCHKCLVKVFGKSYLSRLDLRRMLRSSRFSNQDLSSQLANSFAFLSLFFISAVFTSDSLIYLFIYAHQCFAWVYVCVMVLDTLELELQTVVNLPYRCWELNLRKSRASFSSTPHDFLSPTFILWKDLQVFFFFRQSFQCLEFESLKAGVLLLIL